MIRIFQFMIYVFTVKCLPTYVNVGSLSKFSILFGLAIKYNTGNKSSCTTYVHEKSQ